MFASMNVIGYLQKEIPLSICPNSPPDVDEPEEEDIEPPVLLLEPSEIKAKLDEYVIGQEHAKKILSVAVYTHYKRLPA